MISVTVGSTFRSGVGGATHRALRLFIHPDYKMNLFPEFFIQTDLAIIRTVTPIRFGASVQPIELNTRVVPPGSQVMFAGWGSTEEVKLNTFELS